MTSGEEVTAGCRQVTMRFQVNRGALLGSVYNL